MYPLSSKNISHSNLDILGGESFPLELAFLISISICTPPPPKRIAPIIESLVKGRE